MGTGCVNSLCGHSAPMHQGCSCALQGYEICGTSDPCRPCAASCSACQQLGSACKSVVLPLSSGLDTLYAIVGRCPIECDQLSSLKSACITKFAQQCCQVQEISSSKLIEYETVTNYCTDVCAPVASSTTLTTGTSGANGSSGSNSSGSTSTAGDSGDASAAGSSISSDSDSSDPTGESSSASMSTGALPTLMQCDTFTCTALTHMTQ